MNYLRIGLAVAAVLAAAWLAHRVSLSFSQADEIAEQRAHIDALTLAAARDSRTAQEMALFRGDQRQGFKAFDERLRSMKLTREVPHVTSTGEQVVCVQRDRAGYRRMHNEAVTGTAGVP